MHSVLRTDVVGEEDVKRRAHTQNPKNETETQNGRGGDPNHERAPKPLTNLFVVCMYIKADY